jgi:adenylyltransferase/sulfurtransferase
MKFEDRYSRQVLFPGIGRDGQARLAQGRVVIVGCGATGACVCGLLARAGVGHLLIIDRDYVEEATQQEGGAH